STHLGKISRLERWRSIHPKNNRLGFARIAPSVRRVALKVEAVTGMQQVPLPFQSDVQHAAQHVNKFLALVRISIAATCSGSDGKQMRLHHGAAPSKQVH